MKLLFLIDNLCGGGAEKVLVDILNNLNPKKYNIELFLIRNKGVHLDNLPKGIKINYIYNDKLYENNKFYNIYYFITKVHFKINRILGLKRIFNKNIYENYDAYIPFLEGACIQIVADSKVDGRKIAWIHTDLLKHNIMDSKEEHRVLKAMDKLVCVSEASREALIKKFPDLKEKIKVINNPIDIKSIEKKSKEEVEDLFNNSYKTFIAIGRLEKVKGHDLLIKAHKKLIDKGLNHNILILGTGEELESLNSLIKENSLENSVKLLGFKNNPYKYLNKADYYIMPSRYEGYPLSLCEAIALEKPIISTNFESANEILKNGKLGLIARLEDIDDIADKMEILLKDDNKVKELKLNCNKFKKALGFEEKIIEIENTIDLGGR